MHVLGVELVGVRVELELERTEDEGEAAIVLGMDSICQGFWVLAFLLLSRRASDDRYSGAW